MDKQASDPMERLEALHRFYAHRAEMRHAAELAMLAEVAELLRASNPVNEGGGGD